MIPPVVDGGKGNVRLLIIIDDPSGTTVPLAAISSLDTLRVVEGDLVE